MKEKLKPLKRPENPIKKSHLILALMAFIGLVLFMGFVAGNVLLVVVLGFVAAVLAVWWWRIRKAE